jgi:hypothetical protein
MSTMDEPVTSSNLIDDQDESTFISDEQIETNESSNIQPIPTDGSISNDKDLYDNVSSTSISNQSTFDTQLSAEERATSRYIYYKKTKHNLIIFSITDQPVSSSLQFNASISGSSDYITLDSDRIHYPIRTESNEATPRRIPMDDDEVARMDAEQIPEPIPADITDVAVPNDNAIFVMDDLVSSTHIPKILSSNIDEHSFSSDVHENDELTSLRNPRRQSR